MPTYSLQLLKVPASRGNYKKRTAPHGPRAYIALKVHSTIELSSGSGKKKHPLSPDCVVFSEVDYQINRLIEELQTIRNQARKFFQKEKDKELKWSNQKNNATS